MKIQPWIDSAPNTWTRGRLKNLVALAKNGVWGDDPKNGDSDVRCVRAADFDRRRLRVDLGGLPTRNVDRRTLRQHRLQPGDLILEKSGGGDRQPVGAVVLFETNVVAVCSNFCARLTPVESVDPRFLTYAFAAAYSQGLTQTAIKQTTGIQNLDTEAFLGSPWAYPSLGEQRRIADFLDTETARVDKLQKLRQHQLVLLSQLAVGYISDTLYRQSGAPLVRLGYLATIQSGLTVDGTRELSYDAVTRPYLRVANVQDGYLDLGSVTEITVPMNLAVKSTLRPGDVLMTEGGDLDKLGRGTVWRGELAGCLHQNHVFAVRPLVDKIDSDYLALATRSSQARAHFESTGVRTTNLASTSSSKIRDFRIPLADLREQRRLVRVLSTRLGQVDAAKFAISRQSAVIAERRQALITAAVTGQFDVTTARGLGPS